MLAAVSSKLFIELARVQDRINMSKEISTAACSWLVTAGEACENPTLSAWSDAVGARATGVFLTGMRFRLWLGCSLSRHKENAFPAAMVVVENLDDDLVVPSTRSPYTFHKSEADRARLDNAPCS